MEELKDLRDVMLVVDSLIHYSFKLKKIMKDCPDFMKDYYDDRLDRICTLVDFLSEKL